MSMSVHVVIVTVHSTKRGGEEREKRRSSIRAREKFSPHKVPHELISRITDKEKE